MTREKTYNREAYAFKVVSYAQRSEIEPLLQKAKHWAIISHENEHGAHFHIFLAFDRPYTYKSVCTSVDSDVLTFAQEISFSNFAEFVVQDFLWNWYTTYDKCLVDCDDDNFWYNYID